MDKIIHICQRPNREMSNSSFYVNEIKNFGVDVEYWSIGKILGFPSYFSSEKYTNLNVENYEALKNNISEQDKSTLFNVQIWDNKQISKTLELFNDKITSFFSISRLPQSTIFQLRRPIINWLFNNRITKRNILFKCGGKKEYLVESSQEIGIIDYNYYYKDKIIAYNNGSNYGLFIDEGIPHHPDFESNIGKDFNFIANNRSKISKQYKLLLNGLFKKIEDWYGIKIIIALHPQSKYSSYDFEDRESITGSTPELVKGSQFVIGHCSTAISLAVIHKKPIIIISPDFLKVKALSKISRAYCNALGIDMTSHSIFSSMKKPNLDLDEKLYKKYINDYFCDLKNPSNTYTPKELTNFILNINP